MGVRRGFSGPAAGAAKADPASAARPSLIDIERWFRQTLAGLSQISEKSKAVRYALNQRPALVFYVDDSVERALRAVAPGAKITCTSAPTVAAMYTLIGTCRLNRINLPAYLA